MFALPSAASRSMTRLFPRRVYSDKCIFYLPSFLHVVVALDGSHHATHPPNNLLSFLSVLPIDSDLKTPGGV